MHGSSLLQSTKNTIARIAKSGPDKRIVIKPSVERGCVDRHIRMRLEHRAHALRRCDKAYKPKVLRAELLQMRHRIDCAPTRCEHGIDHINNGIFKTRRELAEVVDGLKRLFVALHPQVADGGCRDEADESVGECEAGSKNRHNDDALRNNIPRCWFERCIDCYLRQFKVSHDLVCHHSRGIRDCFSEDPRRCLLAPEYREISLQERMTDDAEVGKLCC